MKHSKPAAERVRPILLAMERSIDAARQQRLRADAPVEPDRIIAGPPETAVPDETDPPTRARLKARPKRALPTYDRTPPLRSHA